MKIIFMLRTGIIEWNIPQDTNPPFHFPTCATQVRMAGYFLADNLYLRHDELVGMSFAPDDAAPLTPVRRDLN